MNEKSFEQLLEVLNKISSDLNEISSVLFLIVIVQFLMFLAFVCKDTGGTYCLKRIDSTLSDYLSKISDALSKNKTK